MGTLTQYVRRRFPIIVLFAIGGSIPAVWMAGAFTDSYPDLEFARAEEGTFIIDVITRGELRAERSESVEVPPLRGRTQIVWLEQEGIQVEAGQVVARLEEGDQESQVEQRQEALEQAQSNLTSFLANKPSRLRSAESGVITAELDLELAEIQLKLSEFESVQVQEQRRLSYENALLRVEDARRNFEITQNRLIVEERQLNDRIERAQQRLQSAREQLAQTVLLAPGKGILVLGETRDNQTRNMRKIREGDQVRRGQTIALIPDLSEMLVESRITEGEYSKVAHEQPVEVRMDAIQGPVFTGRLERVSPLADYDNRTRTSTFRTIARLDSVNGTMRPGMTATVRILADQMEEALYIPNRAVFYVAGESVVFPRSTLPEPRRVRLGNRNLDSVVVLEGLSPGDEIALSDPRPQQDEPPGPSRIPIGAGGQ